MNIIGLHPRHASLTSSSDQLLLGFLDRSVATDGYDEGLLAPEGLDHCRRLAVVDILYNNARRQRALALGPSDGRDSMSTRLE